MAQTYAVFDAPNASSTTVSGINGRGDFAGYFANTSQGGKTRGYVRDRNGNFIIFDAPNAFETTVSGINYGWEVVGSFANATIQGVPVRGYVRDQNGNFSVFDVLQPPPPPPGFTAPAFDYRGEIAGYLFQQNLDTYRGYVREPNGSITFFGPVAENVNTLVYGINDRGDVAGWSSLSCGLKPPPCEDVQFSFVVRNRNGNVTNFNAPNASNTYAYSINYGGDVAGYFADSSQGGSIRGYVRDRSGNFTVFDAPNGWSFASGAFARSSVLGINYGGGVVGILTANGGKQSGFVRDQSGNLTIFDAPNALSTNAIGINDRGDVAGYFTDSSQGGKTRGFVRCVAVQATQWTGLGGTFPGKIAMANNTDGRL